MTAGERMDLSDARELFTATSEDDERDEFELALVRAGKCLLRELQRRDREVEYRLALNGMSSLAGVGRSMWRDMRCGWAKMRAVLGISSVARLLMPFTLVRAHQSRMDGGPVRMGR
jgi:hypothetical protein